MIDFHWINQRIWNNFWFLISHFWGWVNNQQPEFVKLFVSILYWFFCLFIWRVWLGVLFAESPLLLAYIIITYLYCITMRMVFIGFFWYNLHWDILILMSWLNSIKYIIMNAKILMSRQRITRFFKNSNFSPAIIFIK